MNSKSKAIVKLIDTLYSPNRIKVKKSEYDDEILINVYFSEIDDSYITNTSHPSPFKIKEMNMEFEIRKTVLQYLDIKTSGLDPNTGFSPYKVYGVTIDVILEQ